MEIMPAGVCTICGKVENLLTNELPGERHKAVCFDCLYRAVSGEHRPRKEPADAEKEESARDCKSCRHKELREIDEEGNKICGVGNFQNYDWECEKYKPEGSESATSPWRKGEPPKDGTKILGCWGDGGPRMSVAYWSAGWRGIATTIIADCEPYQWATINPPPQGKDQK